MQTVKQNKTHRTTQSFADVNLPSNKGVHSILRDLSSDLSEHCNQHLVHSIGEQEINRNVRP